MVNLPFSVEDHIPELPSLRITFQRYLAVKRRKQFRRGTATRETVSVEAGNPKPSSVFLPQARACLFLLSRFAFLSFAFFLRVRISIREGSPSRIILFQEAPSSTFDHLDHISRYYSLFAVFFAGLVIRLLIRNNQAMVTDITWVSLRRLAPSEQNICGRCAVIRSPISSPREEEVSRFRRSDNHFL